MIAGGVHADVTPVFTRAIGRVDGAQDYIRAVGNYAVDRLDCDDAAFLLAADLDAVLIMDADIDLADAVLPFLSDSHLVKFNRRVALVHRLEGDGLLLLDDFFGHTN